MRIFLSHSSSDGNGYIDYIVDTMSSDDIVVYYKSFVPGRLLDEEMTRLIESSDVFVLFISNKSITNENVKFEIDIFRENNFDKKNFLPIIISDDIKYDDSRIPDWMREYNLRRVRSPKKAKAIIEEHIRCLSMEGYKFFKEKNAIFLGRNEFVNRFECRYHDINVERAICYCVSGLEGIGRTAFLTHCFKKVRKIRPEYSFQSLTLSSSDSIEDFIFKMDELGVSRKVCIENLSDKTLEEKIEIASHIICSYIENDDVVHIRDNGCIIKNNGHIARWFDDILSRTDSPTNGARIAISSIYKCVYSSNQKFWTLSLPELTIPERCWLLNSYLELYNVHLDRDEISICQNWLQGYPQQVLLLAQSLNNFGFTETHKHSHEIVNFNINKADSILARYADNERVMKFIAAISQFEIVKVSDLLYNREGDNFYEKTLNDLIIHSICVTEGVSNEYIRVNDIIRDYMNRKRFMIDDNIFNVIMQRVVYDFENGEHGMPESSDVYVYITNAISNNKDIDRKYIFPSHLAKCMQETYNKRQGDERVIKLADSLIARGNYIASDIIGIAYYYLCLALARTKQRRVINESEHLQPADKYFVRGFYYRKSFFWLDAINELKKAISSSKNHKRAKRELVITYNKLGKYDEAFYLSKELYEEDKTNIHFAHAYFKCLLDKFVKLHDHKLSEEMDSVIKNITIGGDKRDQSMYTTMNGSFLYYVKRNVVEAKRILTDFLEENDDDIHVLSELFNIADKERNIEYMHKYKSMLEHNIRNKKEYEHLLLKCRIIYSAHNNISEARKRVELLPDDISTDYKNYLVHEIDRIEKGE